MDARKLVENAVDATIKLAMRFGYVVRIETQPLLPLRMGNYRMVPDVSEAAARYKGTHKWPSAEGLADINKDARRHRYVRSHRSFPSPSTFVMAAEYDAHIDKAIMIETGVMPDDDDDELISLAQERTPRPWTLNAATRVKLPELSEELREFYPSMSAQTLAQEVEAYATAAVMLNAPAKWHDVQLQDSGSPRGERRWWHVTVNGTAVFEHVKKEQAEFVFSALRVALAHPRKGSPTKAEDALGEMGRLRRALVYVAYALHKTPQNMLAEGITLIDGHTVRVSRDGWTVEACAPIERVLVATQINQLPAVRCRIEGEKLNLQATSRSALREVASMLRYQFAPGQEVHYRVSADIQELGIVINTVEMFAVGSEGVKEQS